MGISNYWEYELLDALNNNAPAAVTAIYVQLHTGDPTDAGTSAVATDTTRQVVTFASPASPAGTMTNNGSDVTWTNLATGDPDTLSHISLWDASTAGNCLWYGALSSTVDVYDGDSFTIAVGNLTLTLD